jgi:hypothetical protein
MGDSAKQCQHTLGRPKIRRRKFIAIIFYLFILFSYFWAEMVLLSVLLFLGRNG